MNPKSVILDAEEVWKVERVVMSRWLGHGDPEQWDALSYVEQCEIKEIARAMEANRAYDEHKARRNAEQQARTRGRGRRR